MSKPPKILTGVLKPGETVTESLRRAEAKYETLGKPGPALPWNQDRHGGWCRLLAGGERVIALVDAYSPKVGGGYFYCVGDGPTEESSEETFESAQAAKDAADARLKAMGYAFREMD